MRGGFKAHVPRTFDLSQKRQPNYLAPYSKSDKCDRRVSCLALATPLSNGNRNVLGKVEKSSFDVIGVWGGAGMEAIYLGLTRCAMVKSVPSKTQVPPTTT